MFLKYNGVEMTRVQITRFHAENEYGGDSFNATGRRYELDGVGVVATGETPAGGAVSLVTIDQLRTLLSQPRKLLQYRFQDTVAYVNLATSSDGWNGSVAYDNSLASISDSRNGPIPTITIQKIVGTTSKAVFFVAFSFRWFGCSSDRVQRFEFVLTHNIDTSGFTTLNYGGTLEMSNRWSAQIGTKNTPVSGTGSWGPLALENADIGPFPDLYRRLVAPPPPNQFFRRTKQNYVAHPNLRTLTWDIEDKELFRAMPGGTGTQRSGSVDLPDGDALFTFSRGLDPNAGGPQGRKTFEMTLRANRETDPAAMIEYIFRASMARIAWVSTPGVANSYPDIIESVVIEEPNIYTDNKLRVTISAMGSDASTTQVPFNVITRMFTSLAAQTGGNPQYADAYQTGAYINGQSIVDPLKFEICTSLYETLNEVLTPSDSEQEKPAGDDKPFGSKPAELPNDLVAPELNRDAAFTGDADGKIRNYASKQKIETYDTGMFYLEATGSSFQWPVQLRLPVVFVTQTVEMTTVDTSVPIPWPELPGEAVLIKRTEVSVDDAPPDVSGKSVFSVVATRIVQVSIASSPNRLLSEDGIPRVQWSPETVPQARSPYTQNQQFDFRVADKSGNANRQGYVA